jgi:hypothetical protein
MLRNKPINPALVIFRSFMRKPNDDIMSWNTVIINAIWLLGSRACNLEYILPDWYGRCQENSQGWRRRNDPNSQGSHGDLPNQSLNRCRIVISKPFPLFESLRSDIMSLLCSTFATQQAPESQVAFHLMD